MTWSLSLATMAAVGAGIGTFGYHVRVQQQAIATLRDIEVLEFMCVLPAEGATSLPAGVGMSSRKVASPVEFVPNGPSWFRSRIGEERCQKWSDTAIAVNLAGSEANDADVVQLANLPRLKKLNLFSTKVSDVGLAILWRLPALEELHVGSPGITDQGLDHLQRLKQLRVLGICGTITDAGLMKLRRLSALRELQITSREITDDGLAGLVRMETLERLSISGGTITDLGVRHLSRMVRLKQLYLGEVPGISDRCLAQLRDARPGITIVYEPAGPAP
jgi:hypothetical protein